MRLEGTVAVITGGAAGMGRSTALLFAREGARVVVGDRDGANGARLAGEAADLPGDIHFVPCDVSREADMVTLIAEAETRYGRLDTIFNNAGIEQPVTPTPEVSAELFREVLDINLLGTFFGIKHALPALERAGGGTIVNNSSVSAFANVGGNISYAATKGAVMSMTRVVAIEYARRGIRCNAINPGVIDTDMNRRNKALAEDPEAVLRRWSEITPMGRMGTGDEIAEAVLFLASRASSFITGVGLLVDGGRVAT